MSINNIGPTPPPPPGESPRNRRTTSRSSSKSGTTGSSSESSVARETPLAVSTETTELLAQLRQLPEVRDDLVREVQRRLKNGEYFTPEAAKKTAQAIVSEITDTSTAIDTIAGW